MSAAPKPTPRARRAIPPLAAGIATIALGVSAGAAGAVPIQMIPVGVGSYTDAVSTRVAERNGQVWGLDRDARRVVLLDAVAGRRVGEPIPLPPEVSDPTEIAAGRASLWVISPADDIVVRIDPGARRLLDEAIPVGPRPIAVATGFGAVWVANAGGGTLHRLDEATGTRRASVKLGGSPVTIAVGPRFVWVGLRNGNVVAVDPKTNRRNGRQVRVGQGIGQMAVGAGAVYATRFRANKVTRFPIRTRRVAGTISAKRPRGVTVFDGRVWVSRGLNSIERYDPKTSRRAAQPLVFPGSDPDQLLATPAGVWAAGQDAALFAPLRQRLTGTLIGAEGFGRGFGAPLAVGPGAVWVRNSGSDTLTKLSPTTDAPLGRRIPVGADPSTVAVGAGALWVAYSDEKTISRLDPESGAEIGTRVAVPGPPRSIVPADSGAWVVLHTDPRSAVRVDVAGNVSAPAAGSSIGATGALASGPSGLWGMVATDVDPLGFPVFTGLQRYDPVTGSELGDPIGLGMPLLGRPGAGEPLAVGEGSAWVLGKPGTNDFADTLHRVDLASGQVTASVPVPHFSSFVSRDGQGSVWVEGGSGGSLVQVDEATAQPVGLPTKTLRSGANGLASGFGSVWLSQNWQQQGRILRVDPTRRRIPGRSSPVGLRPRDVAFGPAGVWVIDGDSTKLVKLNPKTGRPVGKRVRLGGRPVQVEVGSGVVWVLDAERRQVLRINPARRQVVQRLRVGSNPTAIAAADGALWVVDRGGRLRRVSRASNRVTASIKVAKGASAIAAAGRVVYVVSGDANRLQRIDGRRKRLTARTSVTPGAFQPRVTLGGGTVWVTDNLGSVHRFDATSLRRRGIFLVGFGSEVVSGAGRVWIASEFDSTLTRLDAGSGAPAGPAVPVGEQPLGVAFGAGAVWVASFSDGTVNRIPARTD